jgi:hypothetical protein
MRKKIKEFGKGNGLEKGAIIVFLALIIGIGIFSEIDLVYSEENSTNTSQTNETTPDQESTDTEIKWTGEYGPEDDIIVEYEPNADYSFWSLWSSSLENFSLPISPDGNVSEIKDLDWSCFQASPEDNLTCTTKGIPKGKYTWALSLKKGDKEYSTPLFNLEIERAEPNITLQVSENIIYQNETIGIAAENREDEGKIYLFINDSKINESQNQISINHIFDEPGEYEIKLVYNGSENYLEKTIEKEIGVLPLEFSLTLKGNYTLGEEGEFALEAPDGANSTVKIYGPNETMLGPFAECTTHYSIKNGSYPIRRTLGCINKTGHYYINSTIKYLNITRILEEGYFVSNNLEIEIDGERDLLAGEELDLEASASGGLPPYRYVWKLENGTEIEDKNLNLKLNEEGRYNIVLEVKDKEDNSLSEEFIVDVDEWKEITIRVKDSAGKAIESAYVDFGDRSGYTNKNGEVKVKVPVGEQTLRVEKDDYEAYRRNIAVQEKKTIDVVLELEESLASKLNKIILLHPKDDIALDYNEITFLASVSSAELAECSVFLKAKDSDWFEEIKNFEVEESYAFELKEQLNKGEYQWKIECDINNQSFSSDTASFEVRSSKGDQKQETTIEASSVEESEKSQESIDAGSLRIKIEAGFENLDKLDMESKAAAGVLSVKQELEKALQTFERKMRDLNNLQYRKDLSSEEKKEKAEEYQEELEDLEKNTISFVEVEDSESYVNYPKNEELIQIASDYQDEKGIVGKIDEEKLKELQNKLSVETKVSHVILSFLDNQTKKITLVEKTITYSGEEDNRIFLLENISKDFAESTNTITFLEEQETIKKDPLVKYELKEKINYYTEGFKDFKGVKEGQTILFSNNLVSTKKKGNLITGAFSLPEVDFTSPMFGIILVSIVLAIYLIFSTEIGERIISIAGASKKRKITRLNSLINDALNYIEEGDLNRANMVFKEIKLLYEKMPQRIKEDAYDNAIEVYDKINKAYLSKLIDQTAEKIRKGERLNKVETMERLNQAYELLNEEDKKAMKDEVEDLLKTLNN